MSLRHAVENLEDEAAALEAGAARGAPVAQRERALFDLAATHHFLAIARLLRDADLEGFWRDLVEAARSRHRLLELARDHRLPADRFTAASHFVPLLDAFLAGERDLANEIVGLTPDAWVQGDEYEDDFRFARVLHAFIRANGATPPEAGRRVDEYEASLAGASTARPAVLRALLARDLAGFEQGMLDLVLEWEEQREAETARAVVPTERHLTEKYFFTEGLALIRFAEAAGLAVERTYRHVPEAVRRARPRQGSGART